MKTKPRQPDRLFIHPPFADPTQPYLSLPTLKGHLRRQGFDVRVVDLNVEAMHFLLEPAHVLELEEELAHRLARLEELAELSAEEHQERKEIVEALPWLEAVLVATPHPLDVLRDLELFYRAASYSRARDLIRGFFRALSAASFPYEYHFNRAERPGVPWSFDALAEYWQRRQSPLDSFYRQVFSPSDDEGSMEPARDTNPRRIPLDGVDFIGISIVFPSQIAEAFYIARLLAELAPHAFIVFGGPCIHQAAFHMDADRRARLLDFVSAVGLFEGEETLSRLFELLPQLTAARSVEDRHSILRTIPNLLCRDPSTGAAQLGPYQRMELRDAALPDYSDLDLRRYLAPSPTLLYAPTRGCYWNRCSFCYYGLSETSTARYREVPPQQAASDLAKLARRYGVKNFYISCDVLSPSYALRLAQAILEKRLKIRWSCDLKLDKFFTRERCATLYESGLRSAAFGMESGNDRILQLIDKGADAKTLTEVNRRFHAAGVATEWMTFTGHPGETLEEALQTVRWIRAELPFVDVFVIGEFGLEPGSLIAQNPARYGVQAVRFHPLDDFRLYASFTQSGPCLSTEATATVETEVDQAAECYALAPYPWAGAVSTHHTFLHFLRFGQRAFSRRSRRSRGGTWQRRAGQRLMK